MELAGQLVEHLSRSQSSIAVAESLTGGLLALRLTEAPGSGEVFRGGLVAYLESVKHELLDVPPGPVVTARCAEAMASGVASLLGASVGLSTTGVAGPDDLEGHGPGTVFVGCHVAGITEAAELHLPPTTAPREIREASVDAALELALAAIRTAAAPMG